MLEQNIFYINQVMEFGKFVAVLQKHPTEKNQTIATTYMALAIKTKVLERRKSSSASRCCATCFPASS